VGVAAVATAVNFWLLPRLAPVLLRTREKGTVDLGLVSYPLSVLLLALCFPDRPEIVAAAWGVLAFGDGLATVVGRRMPFLELPWNWRKSWLGTLAYWLFGTLAAVALLQWTAAEAQDPVFLWTACAVVVLGSALLESLPLELDDNLVVPLLTGLGLALMLDTEGSWGPFVELVAERWSQALLWNLGFGLVALLTRGVDAAGLASGVAIGATIYLALGPTGWAVLVTFYLLGTGATRLGFERKQRLGLAERRHGRRSVRNVLANATVPTVCLATTLAVVPPGTEGGISIAGSVAGLLGSLLVAAIAAPLGLLPLSWVPIVAGAGALAVFVDSLLGAGLERRGLLDNEAVNFGATLSAAFLAYWLLVAAG
jgi:uncharacterized membrane protein